MAGPVLSVRVHSPTEGVIGVKIEHFKHIDPIVMCLRCNFANYKLHSKNAAFNTTIHAASRKRYSLDRQRRQ